MGEERGSSNREELIEDDAPFRSSVSQSRAPPLPVRTSSGNVSYSTNSFVSSTPTPSLPPSSSG